MRIERFDRQASQRRGRQTNARHERHYTISMTHYPELLKQIAQPPWVLYAIGRLELLASDHAIAIVGTRVRPLMAAIRRQRCEQLSDSGIDGRERVWPGESTARRMKAR